MSDKKLKNYLQSDNIIYPNKFSGKKKMLSAQHNDIDQINPFIGKDLSTSQEYLSDDELVGRYIRKAKQKGINLEVSDYDALAYNLRKQLHSSSCSDEYKKAKQEIRGLSLHKASLLSRLLGM